ncbi:hypothetical protein EOD10_12210 [Mesorhizobium sp. M7A.T.Ca.TU.009.01.3.2]|nr:hypothetical protein EOD10_12210 [Mesorhizobium sp. M7A.T.Ca.TU.009.01.3.2]RUV14586.1 hypothetical protein EOD00_01075 [Mesorhizobium sp. M7A.T.Ca.TU.009.01.3.1]
MTLWLDETELLLRSEGYSTIRLSGPDALAFEDDELVGFALEYPTIQSLVSGWPSDQTILLSRFAPALRSVSNKAWSVYFVLLTSESATDAESRFLLEQIEGNLSSTRKLPISGIGTVNDLKVGLSPLLPVASGAYVSLEGFEERLVRRLDGIIGAELRELFMSRLSSPMVAQAILEAAK